MYCKYCGDSIDDKSKKELEIGEHNKCSNRLHYCNYCGEVEGDRFHFQYSMHSSRLYFCNLPNSTCANNFFQEKKLSEFSKYANKLPKFDDKLKDVFLNLVSEDYDDYGNDIDPNEFVDLINTHSGYILIYHDSDGRMWYDSVPNNIETLKYVVKKEHRKVLGMNCNQYIDCIIYNGERFEYDI